MEKTKEVTSKSGFEDLFLNAVSPQMDLYFSSRRVLNSKVKKINALRVKAAVLV